jgi:hypothetical protein
VHGRHPLQTTDALEAASTHLGPQTVALIVLLNKQLGLSHGKIATLLRQLLDVLDAPGTLADSHRLAAHLTTELPALFSFRFDPSLDATNWRAEQALRPAVVNRKVSGGIARHAALETRRS